jgi:hypothetical protein
MTGMITAPRPAGTTRLRPRSISLVWTPRAGFAPGEQHPDVFGCEQQGGVERALAAYLLVVERQ